MQIKQYPYLPHRVTSAYGNRAGANLPSGATAWHAGIDIGRDTSRYSYAWSDNPCGPVYAMLDGIVTESRFAAGRGYTVKIDHGTIDGKKVGTLYQHLHKSGLANAGKKVKAGDIIGQMGRTGMGADMMVHLHYELHINGKTVNPLPFFNTNNSPSKKQEGKEMVVKANIVIDGVKKQVNAIYKDGNYYFKAQDLRSPNILIGYENKMPTVTTVKK